jgi:hypothetical protein
MRKKLAFLPLSIVLVSQPCSAQDSISLKDYLPQKSEIPNHDLSKSRTPKQDSKNGTTSISIFSLSLDQDISVSIDIFHTKNSNNIEKIIKNIKSGNSKWVKSLLSKRPSNIYIEHSEPLSHGIISSIKYIAIESNVLIVLQVSKMPKPRENSRYFRSIPLTSEDIIKYEDILILTMNKMRTVRDKQFAS